MNKKDKEINRLKNINGDNKALINQSMSAFTEVAALKTSNTRLKTELRFLTEKFILVNTTINQLGDKR